MRHQTTYGIHTNINSTTKITKQFKTFNLKKGQQILKIKQVKEMIITVFVEKCMSTIISHRITKTKTKANHPLLLFNLL